MWLRGVEKRFGWREWLRGLSAFLFGESEDGGCDEGKR